MSLDIWFREDILHALRAADQASATTAAAMDSAVGDPLYLRAYRQGFRAALVVVATAFGIEDLEEEPQAPARADKALPESQPVVRQRFFA